MYLDISGSERVSKQQGPLTLDLLAKHWDVISLYKTVGIRLRRKGMHFSAINHPPPPFYMYRPIGLPTNTYIHKPERLTL